MDRENYKLRTNRLRRALAKAWLQRDKTRFDLVFAARIRLMKKWEELNS